MNEKTHPLWRRLLPAAVLLVALVAGFFYVTEVLSVKADGEALALARRSLQRAAVECYALEGAYPADADYLARRYGVSVDSRRFIVHYEFIASNLMPQITVIPVKGGA